MSEEEVQSQSSNGQRRVAQQQRYRVVGWTQRLAGEGVCVCVCACVCVWLVGWTQRLVGECVCVCVWLDPAASRGGCVCAHLELPFPDFQSVQIEQGEVLNRSAVGGHSVHVWV